MATVLTSKGREMSVNLWNVTGVAPKIIAWGDGNGSDQAAAVSDVNLIRELAEARTTGTVTIITTTTTNDTMQVVGTITATGTRAVTESALCDTTAKPFATTWATAPTTTSGTTGTVAASFTPANGSDIQSETEVMTVTAGTGTTSLTVTRGVNGSTAVTQTAGHTLTAGNAPGQSGVTNGNMFAHGDFATINLSSGDSIAFTWTVKQT